MYHLGGNTMKKLLSFLLILTIALTALAPTTAEAAVKLNKTKLSLNEGSSYNLQLYGSTKTITWSSSDKTIARVTSKGKVTAVKAGAVTITAKVNSKKYTCKVTVKDVLTDEEAAADILYETFELNNQLLIILTNKNKVNTQVQIDVMYYDVNGDVMSTSTNNIWNFQAGHKAVETFAYPHDDSYKSVEYDKFDIKITADLDSWSIADEPIEQLSIETNKGADDLISTITNNSDADLRSADLTVLYYVGGKIVGYDDGYIYELITSGDSGIVEFSEPYDENYKDIEYDDYEVIINEASFE
jgi:hypothetical protein